MRKAASGWEDNHARSLVTDGFRKGRKAPTNFIPSRDRCGYRCARCDMKRTDVNLREWYDVKLRGVHLCQKRSLSGIFSRVPVG